MAFPLIPIIMSALKTAGAAAIKTAAFVGSKALGLAKAVGGLGGAVSKPLASKLATGVATSAAGSAPLAGMGGSLASSAAGTTAASGSGLMGALGQSGGLAAKVAPQVMAQNALTGSASSLIGQLGQSAPLSVGQKIMGAGKSIAELGMKQAGMSDNPAVKLMSGQHDKGGKGVGEFVGDTMGMQIKQAKEQEKAIPYGALPDTSTLTKVATDMGEPAKMSKPLGMPQSEYDQLLLQSMMEKLKRGE